MFGPTISVIHRDIDGVTRELSQKFPQFAAESAIAGRRLKENADQLSRMAVYVGIPATSAADRRDALDAAFAKIKGTSARAKKLRQQLTEAAAQNINNAELLYIQSKGSPLRGIPARPVLEPAITSAEGRAAINPEMAAAIRFGLAGNKREALRYLRRAGMAARNAARRYFFAQNGWPPLKPETIKRKGSEQPLINTGAMRNAITFVVEDSGTSSVDGTAAGE